MSTDQTAPDSSPVEWDFTTLAYVWDAKSRAISAGADRIEDLPEADRMRSLTALSQRVSALAYALDDGWLAETAFFMIEDLHRSCFRELRWSAGVRGYIVATAMTFMQVLAQRGFVLHYVIDNMQSADGLVETLEGLALVFQAAGLVVTGPQLMALELMEQAGHRRDEVGVIPRYRQEGHVLADRLIERCHRERRSSVYLNLDLDDDAPAPSLDVALSQSNTPGTIVVFRNQAPTIGSHALVVPPPGMSLPVPS